MMTDARRPFRGPKEALDGVLHPCDLGERRFLPLPTASLTGGVLYNTIAGAPYCRFRCFSSEGTIVPGHRVAVDEYHI
jgi:hypothetical protein